MMPDCKYLSDGYLRGRHWRPSGSNADLWAEVATQLSLRKGRVVMRKVTAHMTIDDLINGAVNAQDFFGNAWADALAGRHAELNRVEVTVERRVQ